MGGGEINPLPHQSNTSGRGSKNKDEITVLVTGFGPFPGAPINTSHLLTTHLPSLLPPATKHNRTPKLIRILNPTSARGAYIRVEYAYIRQYIKHLYDVYQHEVDLMLHLGMAAPWEFYSIERYAFKAGFTSTWWGKSGEGEGYYNKMRDVKGKTAKDISESQGRDWWLDAPMGLETSVNVDKAVAVAAASFDGNRGTGGEAKIVPHHEGGTYCCGFIYYESLATCWKRGLKTKVLFSHVPGCTDAKSLEMGREAVLAIIGAACEQIVDR